MKTGIRNLLMLVKNFNIIVPDFLHTLKKSRTSFKEIHYTLINSELLIIQRGVEKYRGTHRLFYGSKIVENWKPHKK
jgi:hypothetical protein